MEQAVWIMAKGLIVVFSVMGFIAGSMWISGRMFVYLDQRAKALKKAEQQKAEQMHRGDHPNGDPPLAQPTPDGPSTPGEANGPSSPGHQGGGD